MTATCNTRWIGDDLFVGHRMAASIYQPSRNKDDYRFAAWVKDNCGEVRVEDCFGTRQRAIDWVEATLATINA